ncbi:MAG: ATP-binding cassette domain-containing protein, partial [Gemmatimonadaceae bacterium]
SMSVLENFALGGVGRVDWAGARDKLRETAQALGATLEPDARVGGLPPAALQQLEIAKALARHCRVLILDEPTALLPPQQAAKLLAWVRGFAAAGGTAVLITHKLQDALDVADAVTVLRHGRTVLSQSAASLTVAMLVEAMLGDGILPTPVAMHNESVGPRYRVRPSGAIVRLIAVSARDRIRREQLSHVSLELNRGDFVGLAGIEGAGHQLLLRILAGRAEPDSGEVQRPSSTGFIPEHRQRDGMALELTLRENIALRDAGVRTSWVNWRMWTQLTHELICSFDIRAGAAGVDRAGGEEGGGGGRRGGWGGQRSIAASLSGGNQQKLVIARELAGSPDLIVAINPTQGLDIRAMQLVMTHLRAACDAGGAVVLYSSDIDQLLAHADRFLVMHGGKLVPCDPSREALGRAMLGVHATS